jgi:hypothetical protein
LLGALRAANALGADWPLSAMKRVALVWNIASQNWCTPVNASVALDITTMPTTAASTTAAATPAW